MNVLFGEKLQEQQQLLIEYCLVIKIIPCVPDHMYRYDFICEFIKQLLRVQSGMLVWFHCSLA